MPHPIRYREQRKIVLKMTIEIICLFCNAYFKGDKPADRVNDMLICAAMLVGQAEGHPLNASKIAEWVQMARPTVIRRLDALEHRGYVVRQGKSFKIPAEVLNSEHIVVAGVKARELIHSACAQLSKLDTKTIARRDR